jgi:sterol desaturase/sphingolipid hydroxylase (fatty acid hydroxylase superfamily)
MDWTQIVNGWQNTVLWMAGLAAGFGVLVWLTPCNRGMGWWKDLRAVCTDLFYWFVVPVVLRACFLGMLQIGIWVVLGGRDPSFLPARGLPLWVQCVAILLIQDVIFYAVHRIFHTRSAWKYHAIHHSPKVVDWMTMARFHPVNSLMEFILADVVVLLMGFSPAAMVALFPFNRVYSAMVHANLNWTFGPLKYVFVSPVFHRWHHTMQKEGLDKNFASTFPILDLLFGTFYMPAGKLPQEFGNGDPDFPEGFWGQLAYPFRAPPTPPPPPVVAGRIGPRKGRPKRRAA